MTEFAFIHQNTSRGQILIVMDYDPLKLEYRVEIKFHSEKLGATLDMSMPTKEEGVAREIFNELKNLDTVQKFISETIPTEC